MICYLSVSGSEDLPMFNFCSCEKIDGDLGVEINIPYDTSFFKKLWKLLVLFQLKLIALQYLSILKEIFSEYMERLTSYTLHLVSVELFFIYSHSWKDYFTFKENSQVIVLNIL